MKRLLLIAAVVFLLTAAAVSAAVVDNAIEEQLRENDKVSVIVKLKDDAQLKSTKFGTAEHKKSIVRIQEEVITAFDESELKPRHRFTIINGFSGEVSAEALEKLKNNPNVERIEYNYPVHAFLDTSVPLINADDVWGLIYNGTNITGAGQSICILDTGVDYNHSALGGGWGNKVIAGYDYINNDADPMDDHGHGTHCAGIAASNDTTYRGVAPDAKIVAIKVLNSAGDGGVDGIIAGIDWCANNASLYNISAISMSFGTNTTYSTYCDSSFQTIADAINNAVAKNITVVAAAGNSGNTTGISAPACIQNATSVGWTTDADEMHPSSNRNAITELVAPGTNIHSTQRGGGFVDMSGTSMATPHVAGAVALLQQYKILESNAILTPAQIQTALNNTGKQIYDAGSGRNYSRIDVYAALLSLDSTSPVLNFTAPTPDNGTAVNSSRTTINITSNEILNSAWIEWGGINYTMNGSGQGWFFSKADNGNVSYLVYGNDSAGNIGQTESRIVTLNDNAPNITSFYPDTTEINIAEPENQTFNVTYADIDNDTITVYWYLDGNLSGSGDNYTYNGSYDSAGTRNVTAIASDGWLTDSHYWNLTINNTNQAPVLNTSVANQTWRLNANNTNINLSQNFYDADGDDLNWTATAVENITVQINNETGAVTLIPDTGFSGTRYVVFTATDGINTTDSNNVTLNVTPNNIPVASNVILTCSDTLNRTNGTLLGSFSYSDADNDTITANETKWYNNSVEVTAFANATSVSANYTKKGQTWIFSARVYDGLNWSSWANSSSITIQNAAPSTPEISSPDDNEISNDIDIESSSTDIDDDMIWYYVYINNTLNATTNSTTISNWAGADGHYSLKVAAYDNTSFSANSSTIYFTKDTVMPRITAISASSSGTTTVTVTLSVTTNENATCRWSITNEDYESMSSMDTTGTTSHSNQESYTTDTSGTYYVRCKDTAGNTMNYSNSTSFTADVSTGNDGGGGGGGGGVGTTSDLTTDSHVFASLSPSTTTTLSVSKADIPFTEYKFNVKKPIGQCTITTKALSSKPSALGEPSGVIYKYLEVNIEGFTNEDIFPVRIQFKVLKSWLEDNGYDKDKVKLQRYTTQWNRLDTKRIDETTMGYIYEAISPGFSYFAITSEKNAETFVATTQETETGTAAEPAAEENKSKITGNTIMEKEWKTPKWAVAGVISLIAVLFFNIFVRSRLKPFKRRVEVWLIEQRLKMRKAPSHEVYVKSSVKKNPKKIPLRCPFCGSAALEKGLNEYFCKRCGTVLS